jgi:3-isopropylmalate dehydratase small subunit
MVIVCGDNMGDIFRRNSMNLGLEVVQSRSAVDDARDGDTFAYDPATRRLTNETQQKTYEPVPLTPKEDEIRRSVESSPSAGASSSIRYETRRQSSGPTRKRRAR